MITQYSQYVNEARAAQHAQDLQREAAAERALRAGRRSADEETPRQAQPSDRSGLGYLLSGLRHQRPAHAGR